MSNTSTELKARQIWQTVNAIPAGKVASYGQIAKLAGLPNCARLVGRVLSQLPKDSKIPWYRVINSQGKISFPPESEAFLAQQGRLNAEGVEISKTGRINLRQFQWNP